MVQSLGFGTVAMAAYRPDHELFRRQLVSIQRQTHENFECLISADGDPDDIRALVTEIVHRDERFHVVGYSDRLGFYGNFERVLSKVSPSSNWVALSDQDDEWDPAKLATLLPHLDEYSLVSGQARVVEYPSGHVIATSTNRRDTAPEEFVLTNQFTGGLCVFRPAVLQLALPFPRMKSPSEVHDHWLAVCASAQHGTLITDDIVQDYTQHGENAIGEQLSSNGSTGRARSWETLRGISDRYEGSHSPTAVLRAAFKLSVGWRQLMVETLAQRAQGSARTSLLVALYGRKRRFIRTLKFALSAEKQGAVARQSVLEYGLGWAAGVVTRGRTATVTAKEV
jgi:hypothetical protein